NFEVASIKPGSPQFIGPRLAISSGGRVRAGNVNLRGLIEEAYQLKPFQLTGGPRWMDSESFEVIGKGDESATNDQVRLMLQSLLKERFQLEIHKKTRKLTISELLVKGNPKLSPAKEGGRFGVGTSTTGRGATSNHVVFKNTLWHDSQTCYRGSWGHMVEDQT